MKTLLKLLVLIAASVALSVSAQTSDWTGGDGNWSSNDNPGWNGTGAPNAVGAVANFSDATAIGQHFTTNVDIPATVGSINFNANGDLSRAIITVNSLTMNNGGSGAVISNSNPSTGINNFLIISSGQNANLVLADDLLVINTSGSTAPNDAILISNLIQGTGNVTFSTVGNTVTDQVTAPGSIRIIQNGTYVGNVLVQKGAIVTSAFQAFGDPGNMVTLGQAGQGDVTMMATTNNVDMSNPFTVAAGTGGTTVVGSLNTQGSTFSGDIALNGNLTVNSWVTQVANPGAFILDGTISGQGGLTFTTSTSGDPTKIISELDTFDSVTGNPNTYTGGTIVNAGTLIAKGNGALGAGNVSLTASNVQLTLTSNGTSKIADTAALSLFDSTDKLNLNFSASRNEKVAVFRINGVAQPVGTYNSTNLPGIISGTGQIQVLVGDAQITSVAHTGGHFLIAGLTAPNVTVTVHASNDLVSFDNGVQVTADASGVFNYDDATGLTQRFYQVSYP